MPGDRNRTARRIFRDLPPRYDRLAEVLSFRQNRRWQTAMLGPVLAAKPRRCLDVATGTAAVAIRLADRVTREEDGTRAGPRVFGIDLSPEMLAVARRRTVASRVEVSLALARAEELPFEDRAFDSVTFTYLLRYVEDPASTLRELTRVLRPGGVMSSLEFFVPPIPAFKALWMIYTRALLPLAGRMFGREWHAVGRFLGPDISAHYRRFPLDDHVRAWKDAGIPKPHHRLMSLGGGLVMWGTRE